MSAKLDKEFKIAVEKASKIQETLPPDTLLRLYAYYKQAIKGDNFLMNTEQNIKSAFKFNAWIQLQGMSEEQAKAEYISLVNSITT